MSEVAGQVLDQAHGLATRVAGISSDLMTLQQAGVSIFDIFAARSTSAPPIMQLTDAIPNLQ